MESTEGEKLGKGLLNVRYKRVNVSGLQPKLLKANKEIRKKAPCTFSVVSGRVEERCVVSVKSLNHRYVSAFTDVLVKVNVLGAQAIVSFVEYTASGIGRMFNATVAESLQLNVVRATSFTV